MSDSAAGQPCNVYLEEFHSVYGLHLTECCIICGLSGARHTRRDGPLAASNVQPRTSSSNLCLSSISQSFLKLESHLPRWAKSSTDVRAFLRKTELVLRTNEGIPEESWNRSFLYSVQDTNSVEWIIKHIIDKQLSWTESKSIFISHFERAEYKSQLMSKFRKCKQYSNETTQMFSDRFVDLVDELNASDTDQFVIDQYLQSLRADVRKQYEQVVLMKRIQAGDVCWQESSLTNIINDCIIADLSSHASGLSFGRASDQSSSTGKWCSVHNSSTHDTNECRSRSSSNTTASATDSSSSSAPTCYKCHAVGHYANRCNSTVATNSSINSSESTTVPSTRPVRAPAPVNRLTYDGKGQQSSGTSRPVPTSSTTSNIVTSSHAHVVPSSIVQSNSEPQSSVVFFISTNTGTTYRCRTLVDTGSSNSFIDSSLAAFLNLHITPVTGTVRLATSNAAVNRVGITDALDVSAVYPLLDLNQHTSIKLSHQFDVMSLDVDRHEFIIGRDLLPMLFPDGIPYLFYAPAAAVSACVAVSPVVASPGTMEYTPIHNQPTISNSTSASVVSSVSSTHRDGGGDTLVSKSSNCHNINNTLVSKSSNCHNINNVITSQSDNHVNNFSNHIELINFSKSQCHSNPNHDSKFSLIIPDSEVAPDYCRTHPP